MDVFTYLFGVFAENSMVFIAASCACFLAYMTWYFAAGKQYASLTPEDVRILWKIHKQTDDCKSKKWRMLRFKDKIIGFECGCGHRHIEKRPLV